MKKFKWVLDRSVVAGSKEENVSDSSLFISYLNGACRSAYKDGMGNDLLRRLFNISNKIEQSTNGTIELEDAEFTLIEESFQMAKFDPIVNKMVVQIYDKIDAAKKKDIK